MSAEPLSLPFAAALGLDDTKCALECALVSPLIRTVLIRGPEGTAKTTAARATAGLTDRRLVNCPLNITDEQLYGGLDLETALKTGETHLEPGLLARANGNLLYIDDVNLMDRSLLAGILDSVLTGQVTVERGPISATYPCHTTLIATMNPADSDLSAHVLDRFALCACVGGTEDKSQRREILRRNADFAVAPQDFAARYAPEEEQLRERVDRARQILPLVTVSDELVEVTAELCVKVGADGLRGDLALINCAKALAALNGRDEVTKKDLEEAAVLCLSHRRNYSQPPPPQPPQLPEQPPDQDQQTPDDQPPNQDQQMSEEQPPEQPPDQDQQTPPQPPQQETPNLEELMFEIGQQFRVIDYLGNN